MKEDIGRRLVDAIDEYVGVHPGARAAHAKGVCCDGTFTATPEAKALTTAAHMQSQSMPVVVRFSNASNEPEAADYKTDVVGMAVKFLLPDGRETDIVAINLPVFFVRDPEHFIALTKARRTSGRSGRPAMYRILAFALTHPESIRAFAHAARLQNRVVASRLQTRYFGIHAFKWIDARGEERHVRYELAPKAGEQWVARARARELGGEFLRDDLEARLAAGPAKFDLWLTLAQPGDRVDDPTRAWPAARKRVHAGQLQINAVSADQDAGCERRVFDPTRVIDGIECSKDRVLLARRLAYSVSIERRLA